MFWGGTRWVWLRAPRSWISSFPRSIPERGRRGSGSASLPSLPASPVFPRDGREQRVLPAHLVGDLCLLERVLNSLGHCSYFLYCSEEIAFRVGPESGSAARAGEGRSTDSTESSGRRSFHFPWKHIKCVTTSCSKHIKRPLKAKKLLFS